MFRVLGIYNFAASCKKKDTIFGAAPSAARKIFGPSYFVTALGTYCFYTTSSNKMRFFFQPQKANGIKYIRMRT